MARRAYELPILMAIALIVLIISGLNSFDRLTWFLEVLPVLIAVPLLVSTCQSFPLTPLLYRLLLIHGIISMIGGHYTYARVPPGSWAADLFHLACNHYDRLGHTGPDDSPSTPSLVPGKWLFFLVTSVCLAFSAFYEFTEWWAPLLGGKSAEAFLGAQGDVWGSQWDMFLALIGAVTAQIVVGSASRRGIEADIA